MTKPATPNYDASQFHSLVDCLRAGDRKAIEKLWQAFGPDLRRRARTRLRQFGLIGHTESMDICNDSVT